MTETSDGKSVRLVIEPEAAEAWLQRVRAELKKGAVHALTVDMGSVARADPGLLSTLRAAGDEARQAGKELFVDRTSPTVYKSMQLAKLGPLFRRRHHGAAPV